ncbi:EF-hand domain-containing protein, partial [Staphylococcus aureus]|nr:EF-hand domain-containing protein [Staphylococcus aureus]
MRADFLARVDTNKDGKISRSEAEANAPHLAVLFDAIDTNKDGQLTQEELDTFHKKMQEARDSERKH